MLFFYYFVTAFCEVYKNTQISWLSDSLSSFLLSFCGDVGNALFITILYIISIKYKLKCVYNMTLFLYNI